MNYYRFNDNFEYIGTTETEPVDSLWTNIDYIDSFIKPMFIDGLWVEGANNEELESTKQSRIKELKMECFNELQLNDWYFIRKKETGQDVPKIVLDQRKFIRSKYNNLIKFIKSEENTNEKFAVFDFIYLQL